MEKFVSLEKLLFTHKPLATQNDCAPAESYQNLIRRGGQNPKTVGIPTLFGFSDLFKLDCRSGICGILCEFWSFICIEILCSLHILPLCK
jgi:hypothetical protein